MLAESYPWGKTPTHEQPTHLIHLPSHVQLTPHIQLDQMDERPIALKPERLSDLIHFDRPSVLISFSDLSPNENEQIRRELERAREFGIYAFMLGVGIERFLANALMGAGRLLASLHGAAVCGNQIRPAIFVPSVFMLRLFHLSERKNYSRCTNSLLLCRDGYLAASWRGVRADDPHNWDQIEIALQK